MLVFLHIPKTAGTSLNALLSGHFPPEAIAPFHTGQHSVPETAAIIQQTPPEELARYRYFATHLDASIVAAFPRRPLLITVLRHPLERVLSNFAHLKQHRTRLYDVVQGMTLHDFVTSPLTRDQAYNRQTCQLAGITLGPNTPPPPDLLAQALTTLQAMPFVGLQEHFGLSVRLLNATFGWPQQAPPQLNTSAREATWRDLPPDDLQAVLAANQLDMALYEAGRQIFNQRLAALLDDTRQQADALRAIQAGGVWPLAERLHRLRGKLAPPGSRRERLLRRLRDGLG